MACDWKNCLKLTARLRKAYFSGIAQINLAFINSGTVFRLLEIKDPYRPVLSTILCLFLGFLLHSPSHYWCQPNSSHNYIQKLAMHTLSLPDFVLISIFFHFQTLSLAK